MRGLCAVVSLRHPPRRERPASFKARNRVFSSAWRRQHTLVVVYGGDRMEGAYLMAKFCGPLPGKRPACVGVERAEEGSSGSGTTDSAAFCGIAAAADSRDGVACTGG